MSELRDAILVWQGASRVAFLSAGTDEEEAADRELARAQLRLEDAIIATEIHPTLSDAIAEVDEVVRQYPNALCKIGGHGALASLRRILGIKRRRPERSVPKAAEQTYLYVKGKADTPGHDPVIGTATTDPDAAGKQWVQLGTEPDLLVEKLQADARDAAELDDTHPLHRLHAAVVDAARQNRVLSRAELYEAAYAAGWVVMGDGEPAPIGAGVICRACGEAGDLSLQSRRLMYAIRYDAGGGWIHVDCADELDDEARERMGLPRRG